MLGNGDYDAVKRQVVRDISDDGWTVDSIGVLICPCGYRIEDDGECPEGHVSPLRRAGLI